VVDEYSYGNAAAYDPIDLFDSSITTWTQPQHQLTTWGKNLYGLTTSGNYLYVVAFETLDGADQKSGEIIRVDMTKDGFPPDKRYVFDPYQAGDDAILRRPCAARVIGDKLYVLTYTYDGVHTGNAQFATSEVFEFDLNLNFLRKLILGSGSLEAKNAQYMQVFNGKLYVGSTGGAQGAEARSFGGLWEIDPSTLSEKQLLDLGDLDDSDLAGKDKGVQRFQITKDGTVYLLVGGYDSEWNYSAKLYVSTVARLSEGEIGEEASAPSSISEILYDEQTETLWVLSASWIDGKLYAYDKNAALKKEFTPDALGDPAYMLAIIDLSAEKEAVSPADVKPASETDLGMEARVKIKFDDDGKKVSASFAEEKLKALFTGTNSVVGEITRAPIFKANVSTISTELADIEVPEVSYTATSTTQVFKVLATGTMKKLTEGSEYDFKSDKLHVYIADGSEYDLDALVNGSIADPLVIAEVSDEVPAGGGSSSGGCNTGLGIFAFALAIVAFERRHK
jgi:hypothetical protein